VPLMATHLDASTEEFVGIAAVTPAHVPSQVTSSGAIATLVPHETSLLVASTLYIASMDVPAFGIRSVTPAHVPATSGDTAAPAAFGVASSGDTIGSRKKRPMNETE